MTETSEVPQQKKSQNFIMGKGVPQKMENGLIKRIAGLTWGVSVSNNFEPLI